MSGIPIESVSSHCENPITSSSAYLSEWRDTHPIVGRRDVFGNRETVNGD